MWEFMRPAWEFAAAGVTGPVADECAMPAERRGIRMGIPPSQCPRAVPGCRVKDLGCGMRGEGFRVHDSPLSVRGSGFRVSGLGSRVQDSWCRGYGAGSGFKLQESKSSTRGVGFRD